MLGVAVMLMSAVASAQKGTIKGKVSGSEGALEAATVTIGKNRMVTDKNGNFSVTLNPGSYTLVVTHVGQKEVRQEVTVSNGTSQTVDVTLIPAPNSGEVVVLGSRSLVQRSNLNTAVPVDVFSAQQLEQTGQVSLTQMLTFSAPSFNASRPLINEPVTLRGLNPDQVLILVNGTRRHNMAYITPAGVRGMLGAGTVANDLNSIPFTAIEKIEILRDGAAAQYGSDAIAGVINIELKKSTNKTSVQLQGGRYYKGDGESFIAGINQGVSLNKRGFLNFSADFRHSNPTYRGGEYTGTVYNNNKTVDDSIVRARNFDRNSVSNARTSPQTRAGVLVNGGYPVGKRAELFWTGAANYRKTSFVSGYTFPKNTNRINPELFPNGFGARPYHYVTDLSGIAGARGETRKGWHWEYTSAYGNNTDKYNIENTNNPSQFYTLGKNAPTSFYTGTLIYSQLTNNLQFSKNLSSRPDRLLNLSLGAEWRLENFQMKAGEEGSWENYDSLLARKVGGSTGLIVYPRNAVNESRHVAAAYIDFETEVAHRLLVDLAGRFEHYNDFGGNYAGKIATRYKFSDKFSVRASLNNGFRAPSLQQRYFSSTNRSTVVIRGVTYPSTTGTFRNDSEVAQALGIPNLTAERSVNVSGGVTAAVTNHIRLTVDAYWIQIKNRIVLSGPFDTTNRQVRDLLLPYSDITQVRFYVNAISTRTQGVDIVLNGNWKIKKANLLAMLAANFTQTTLFGDIKAAGKLTPDSINTNTLFGREEKGKLEHGQPNNKIILSLNYKTNKFGLVVRSTRFGKTGTRFNNPAANPDENFSPKILTDFNLNYTPKSWLTLTAGANNIFNVYPDPIRNFANTESGSDIYSKEASPFGFNGGYYFVGMGIRL
jgi:iron complex outermembrane receptor protein